MRPPSPVLSKKKICGAPKSDLDSARDRANNTSLARLNSAA
jgi:hypothetical protein